MAYQRRKQEHGYSVFVMPIKNTPELSRRIGYLASMQRAARNLALQWLREEPGLFLRQARLRHHPVLDAAKNQVRDEKGRRLYAVDMPRPRRYSVNGRFTDLVEQDRALPEKERKWAGKAPRHIYDRGLELGYLSHRQFMAARAERLEQLEAIRQRMIAGDYKYADGLENDKRRVARLARPRPSQVDYVSRKDNSWTLDIANHQSVSVAPDRKSVSVKHGEYGFRLLLQRALPRLPRGCGPDSPLRYDYSRNVTLKIVETERSKRQGRNRPLEAVEYEVRVTIPSPYPVVVEPDGETLELSHILALDAGVAAPWATNTGELCRIEGPAHTRARRNRVKAIQKSIQCKRGGIKGNNPGKRRRKLEARRRELLRRERADRRRQVNDHAIRLLSDGYAMVAVEDLQLKPMLSSAKGGPAAPGKNVAAKRGLNRSLSQAAIAEGLTLLESQAVKRGAWFEKVIAAGSSLTCSRCGFWRPDNRKSQAVFQCQQCGHSANADVDAAAVLAHRGFYLLRKRQRLSVPWVDEAPTGWRTQPSRPGADPGEGVSVLPTSCCPGRGNGGKTARPAKDGESAQRAGFGPLPVGPPLSRGHRERIPDQ